MMGGFQDPQNTFADALRAAGFRLSGLPEMDGEYHRCAVEGDRGAEKSGSYRGYLDGRPAGAYRNFRDETRSGKWVADAEQRQIPASDREVANRLIEAAKARKAAERAGTLSAIAGSAEAAWNAAVPAPAGHPYLLRKGISADGLRMSSNRLLVPMRNMGGQIRGLQTIDKVGRKLFPKGGTTAGLQLLLGHLEGTGPLLVAEGYATGWTLHAATGCAVAVAFAKTNFVAVALAYLERVPGLRVAFCGDNDHHHPRRNKPLPNVGKDAAEAAVLEVGGKAVLPVFEPQDEGTDWNDYAAQHGLEAVRHAVLAAGADPVRTSAPPVVVLPHFLAPTSTIPEALAALDQGTNQFFDDAVRSSIARREWKTRLAEIEETHEVGSRERRAALRDGRRTMVATYGAGWRTPGRRALMPAAAGSGKSTLAASAISKHKAGLGVLHYLTDNTNNAKAVASRIPGMEVVRGRSATDPGHPNGATMCLRPGAAERVAQAGLSVGQTLCSDGKGKVCPFFSECGWQAQKRRNLSGEITAFAGSHNYLTLHGPMPQPDVVVIDENSVSSMIGYIEFGFDRLLPTETAGYRGGNLGAAIGYRDTMVKVCNALRDPSGALASLRSQGITDTAGLGAAVAYLRAVEEGEFTGDLSPDMADAQILDQLDRHEQSEIRLILKLLVALQEEIGLPRDHAHGVAYHPNKPVRINGKTEFQNRVSVHYRKTLSFAKDVPVLLLDASGDELIYRQLFSERLENIQSVKCERNMEVVQVRDVTMAKSSLMGVDRYGNALSDKSASKAAQLRGELTNAANALAQKRGPFFAASYKKVVEQMRPALSDEVLTGHFGNLRGSNEFENCTAGMIIGRHQVPVEVVEADARALWSDDPEPLNLPGHYSKATRGIRMRDGSGVPVEVDVHPDPRVQRVLELYREREAEQGGDRLRAIHNPESKILYVVCNLPLDMTVDRVITKAQLMHEATGAIDNGKVGKARRLNTSRLVEAFRLTGGLLPTNRRELWHLAQDKTSVLNGLWDSEKAVRNDLDSISLRELIGQCRLTSLSIAKTAQLEPVTITYRHAGPGPSSAALVAIPGEAGKLALERLLGRPIVSYASDAPVPEPMPAVDVVVNKLPPWQVPVTRPAMPAKSLGPMPWQRNAPAVSAVIPGVTFTVVSRMQFAVAGATVGAEMFTEH